VEFDIDFIGRSKVWLAISGFIVLVSIVTLVIRGLNFGIEFMGGTLLDLKLKQTASVTEIRTELDQFGLGNSVIQATGDKQILIRSRSLSKNEQKDVANAIDQKWQVVDKTIHNVGPGWGAFITQAALVALALSILGLLIYISLRFEFKMAVSAIVAVVHDVLITIGIYALVAREVTPNTVAALLSILGYSLYDSIVVFHRIQENTPRIGKRPYSDMVNESINQVLVRSINTTLTTLFPVIGLLLIGGETLKDFAFALTVGLITGAYSSIFVASPLLSFWKEFEPRYRSLKLKYGKA
jgi:SecD/SecF fusion protein